MVRFGYFLLFLPAGTVFRKIVGSILAREIVACVARFGYFLSFWLPVALRNQTHRKGWLKEPNPSEGLVEGPNPSEGLFEEAWRAIFLPFRTQGRPDAPNEQFWCHFRTFSAQGHPDTPNGKFRYNFSTISDPMPSRCPK